MSSVKSILLIEPNSLILDIYLKFFKQKGFKVDCCKSGLSAVTKADSKVPDIVVMELQLPGHGGIEFLHEFRSYSDWQNVPVVINSFVPDRINSLNKKRLGIRSYCYKPSTSLQNLYDRVKFATG